MPELYAQVQERLLTLAEPGYRVFAASLMPGTENVLGVRIPALRGIAKELARGDWQAYFAQNEDRWFEETMLQGLTVGYLRADIEEVLAEAARFIPKITNWSLCDSFCAGLKITKSHRERVWAFIQDYVNSECPYDVRFAVVIMLWYFVDETYTPEILRLLEQIRSDDYYVKMAVAWAISICYVNFPDTTQSILTGGGLDDFTHNKALQKICESRRPSAGEKARLRTLRRT